MMTFIAAVLAVQPSAAPRLELLGLPCRGKQVLGGRVVVDRKSGREQFVITNMNEATGAEIIFIDPESGKGEVVRAPKGSGSWAIDEVPGDRLVVGTYYDGTFMVYDLKARNWIATSKFPGEDYIWNHALGGDGRLYGGTYPGGKLGALDLKTYAIEDCGAPTKPNQYLRYVSPMPDGRILCSFGMEKPTTRIYDPAKKTFEAVPAQLEGVSMAAVWNGYLVAGNRVYDRSLAEVKPVPFPVPPAEKGDWYADVYLTDAENLYLRQGNAIFRYRKGGPLQFLSEVDLRGGRILAGSKDGSLLGVRGQDYFVLKPGSRDAKLLPIPGESGPRPTLFLKVAPDGIVWGGPHFGQTLFWMNPSTRKFENTRTVCDGGGEVYDATFHKGHVFAAAYSGGDLVRFDPKAPWDQWNGKNPKTIASLGPKGYIRPTGGIVVSEGGMLVSAWMAAYGKYGGAIAVTDPETGQTDLIENPLGEQALYGLSLLGSRAFAGTSLSANGLPTKPNESPRFGVYELATKKATILKEFPGAVSVRNCVTDAQGKRVFFQVDGTVWWYDAANGGDPRPVEGAPKASGNQWSVVHASLLWYGTGKSLVKLDTKTLKSETVLEAPASISNVAVGLKGEVYVSCGAEVYRLAADR